MRQLYVDSMKNVNRQLTPSSHRGVRQRVDSIASVAEVPLEVTAIGT